MQGLRLQSAYRLSKCLKNRLLGIFTKEAAGYSGCRSLIVSSLTDNTKQYKYLCNRINSVCFFNQSALNMPRPIRQSPEFI